MNTTTSTRTRQRLRALLPSGLISAVALTGCATTVEGSAPAASDTAPTEVSVLLDWAPNPDHAALYTAQATGAYREAGVAPSFTTPSNTADAAREVSLGRVDLAVSYEPDTLIAVGEGLDVVSVAALIPTSLTSLIARSDAGIRGASDLQGRTVGISGLASQEPTINFIARNAGIDPASVTMPNLQQSLNQALLTDQVDAVFGAFRNIEGVELAEQGDFVILPVTELGVPEYSELVLIANPTRLGDDEAYAQRVRAFLSATAKGQQAAVADPQKAVDALTPETEGSYEPELLKRMVQATVELLPEGRFGEQSPEAWAGYAAWMHENGLLDTDVDGASATTNDYLPAG